MKIDAQTSNPEFFPLAIRAGFSPAYTGSDATLSIAVGRAALSAVRRDLVSRPAAFFCLINGVISEPSEGPSMHIIYVDDSGSVENANEKHFVQGGVAVF